MLLVFDFRKTARLTFERTQFQRGFVRRSELRRPPAIPAEQWITLERFSEPSAAAPPKHSMDFAEAPLQVQMVQDGEADHSVKRLVGELQRLCGHH